MFDYLLKIIIGFLQNFWIPDEYYFPNPDNQAITQPFPKPTVTHAGRKPQMLTSAQDFD